MDGESSLSNQLYIHVYRVIERLGKGCFSSVFKAEHRTNGRLVAIKVEPEHATIKHESRVLAHLRRELAVHNCCCVPTLYWYGIYGGNICLAMTFYSQSLPAHINRTNLLNMLDACHQIISAFRWIHETGIIHCDVKPDNFMVDERGRIVVIDFGLASMYITDSGTHVANEPSDNIIGSPKYASYFVHQGNRISRRDDLISIGYLAMWIFGVEMEWQDIYTESDLPIYCIRNDANIKRAKYKKPERLLEYLDGVETYSKYLVPYFEDIYSLEHDQDPNYIEYLRGFSTLY